MANYRQMYLDLLSEHNPKELKRLKACGKLESVLNRVRDEAAAEEGRLTREIAASNLGKNPLDPSVPYGPGRLAAGSPRTATLPQWSRPCVSPKRNEREFKREGLLKPWILPLAVAVQPVG